MAGAIESRIRTRENHGGMPFGMPSLITSAIMFLAFQAFIGKTTLILRSLVTSLWYGIGVGRKFPDHRINSVEAA